MVNIVSAATFVVLAFWCGVLVGLKAGGGPKAKFA